MTHPTSFFHRLTSRLSWRSRDAEMDAEMAFHIDAITDELIGSGMHPRDAARAARKRFGSARRFKEQGHDLAIARFVDALVRDGRHVLRGFRRQPGFAVAVVLTLALGLGGNTAIFSLVDRVWLRPLPYPQPEQLARVYETFPGMASFNRALTARNVASPANWFDWQRDAHRFQSLGAWRIYPVTLTDAGDPVRLGGVLVTYEFFPTIGVTPMMGRTVSENDDRPNAPQVAVISHALWQRRFNAQPDAIGRIVQMNDRPTEIIGVMPASFQFPERGNDVWLNFRMDRTVRFRETSGRFLNVIGRVAAGSSVPQARAELLEVARHLAETESFNKNTSVEVVPLREDITGQVQTPVLVLFAAVGLLFSIACFNVANLLLARGASRLRDMAIRTSLGAARSVIIRQQLVESVLLASAGGLLGIVLARWTLSAISSFVPIELLPTGQPAIDWRITLYGIALSTVTGISVGLVPAWLLSRTALAETLRTEGGRTTTHSSPIRRWLVVGQVALTVLLLCGAGLLVRTLVSLQDSPTGIDRHGVLTLQVQLPAPRYNAERTRAFYREAEEALRRLPGVEAVASGNSLAVVDEPRGGTAFHRAGTPPIPIVNGQPMFSSAPVATIRVVTPGYFKLLRIPVLRGREFVDADALSPAPGFIVNQAFVNAYLEGIDPIGVSLSAWMAREDPYAPILGVVGDVNEGSVRGDARPTIFYSHRQLSETGMTLLVRGAHPEGIASPAVSAIRAIDPALPVTRVRTFDDAVAESLMRDRLSALVSSAFALSGLLLASLGLYGLLAFMVTERTREIGTRMALGAERRQIVASVLADGLRLVGGGALIGLVMSLVLFRLLRTLWFGVTAYDPVTYAGVFALLLSVGALAAYIPARRAAGVSPQIALRQE